MWPSRPIDEARLAKALGGVTRELFGTMFGLDHRTLRDGARALLRGEGGVGESLFDAGGARGIGEVLAGLHAEAARLFKPRGQTQVLNEALKAFKEAGRAVVIGGTVPRTYVEQQRAVSEAQARRDELADARRALLVEQKKLQRARRVLPHLAKRSELLAERADLGDVPRMAADAGVRRVEAQRIVYEAGREAERLRGDLAALSLRAAALHIDDDLADLDDATVERLHEMLQRHTSARDDLPKLHAKLAAHQDEARGKVRELGRDIAIEQVDSLHVDRVFEKRIEALGKQKSGLVAERDAALRIVGDVKQRIDIIGRKLAALPVRSSNSKLRGAVSRAQRAGDLDTTIDEAHARCESLADQAQRRLETLGRVALLKTKPLERVATMMLPEREQVRFFAEQRRALDDADESLAEQREALEAERDEVVRQRDELAREGDVSHRSDARRSAPQARRRANALAERVHRGQAAAGRRLYPQRQACRRRLRSVAP